MTETSQTQALDQAAPVPLTAGQLLRAERLKAGVHLAVLSVTLKVPVKQLEALEADQIDPAKGAVFLRGLASAVCRHLHVDPAPVLALLPTVPAHLAPQRSVGEAPSPARRLSAMRSPGHQAWPSAVWGAAGMVILIAALLWLPSPAQWLWLDDLKHSLSWASVNDESAESDVAPTASPGPNVVDFPQASPVMEPASATTAMQPSDPAQQAPVQSGAQQPTAPLAAPTPPAPAQASSAATSSGKSAEWVFSASADSWIELKNGANTVVWSGLLKSGQSQKIQSPLPVSVVVGRAQAVTVTLRGQAFDLKPHTQVTVARFEVKE